MESPAEDKTPLNEVKLHSENSAFRPNRSAPTLLSKSSLTPCRRMGLKRKSTPGIIFQSPLKDRNSIISGQTITSSAPSLGKNNLFSKTSNLSGHDGNAFQTPSSEKKITKATLESSNHESEPSRKVVKTFSKLSSTKTTTPILSRHRHIGQCSLSKKLKLSSKISLDHDTHSSENSLSYLTELSEALDKNHDSFLKLYHDFTTEHEGDGTKNPQKYEVILRMKNMFDQIKELKQSLINAKQHDILKLETLTKKWRDGCQKALHILLEKLQQQGHKCDMSQLLLESGIPSKLVNYDEDTQDFLN